MRRRAAHDADCSTGATTARIVHRFAIESGRLHADIDPLASDAASGLAPDQQAAVLHAGGPARILAPAGSGKTTVLAARFRHLVVERGYGAASVCALAYNRRAGAEMQDRLADLPRDAQRKVRTLNSFGYEIVRRARPNVRVIDEREIRNRIEPHLTLRFRANTDALRPYLEALEEVAARPPPARGSSSSNAATSRASPAMFRALPRLGLADDDAVDFDGQIAGAIEILLRDPALRAAVQRECRHLLVDEFQDLRPAHLLLVRLVAAPAYDVFGVGDDDQVIYGYSGADPGFLINFSDVLPRRRRSSARGQLPVPAAGRRRGADAPGAQPAPRHQGDARRADRTPTTTPHALRIERVTAEEIAPRATDLIEEWLEAGDAPESIAVLCRVNSGLLAVQVLAHDRGLPITAAVGEQFLRRTGVRSALAYLRLACAVADGNSVPRHRPRRGGAPAEPPDHREGHRRDAQPPRVDAVDLARAGRRARVGRHRARPHVRRRSRRSRQAGAVRRRGGGCCAPSVTTSASARRWARSTTRAAGVMHRMVDGTLIARASGPVPAAGTVRLGPEAGEDVVAYLTRAPTTLPPDGARAPALVQLATEVAAPDALAAVAGTTPLTAVFRVPITRVQTALRFVALEPGVPVAAALDNARVRAERAAAADAGLPDRPGAVAAAEAAALGRADCRCVVALVVDGDRAGLSAVGGRAPVRAVEAASPGTTDGELALSPLLPEQTARADPLPDDGPVPGTS